MEQLKKATDRIQKEIEEVTEREHELRNVGSIKTTSHETVDSKVGISKGERERDILVHTKVVELKVAQRRRKVSTSIV